jgi:CheY-like chemotaxis protein
MNFLIVDDDGSTRDFICTVLAAYEATFYTAGTNAEALQIVEAHDIDLITSDIVRPEAFGVELLCALRENEESAHIPFILISGNLRRWLREEPWFLEWGVDAAFEKPFSVDHLFRAVSRVLRKGDRDATLRLIRLGRETRDLDYKASIDTSDKVARARLAKDVIAMCNAGGGTIISGVAEPEHGRFVAKGVAHASLKFYEVTNVNKALEPYVGQAVAVSVQLFEHAGCWFPILRVPPAKGVPILARCDHQDAALYMGRIYSRTDAAESVEIRDPIELSGLLERIRNTQ